MTILLLRLVSMIQKLIDVSTIRIRFIPRGDFPGDLRIV